LTGGDEGPAHQLLLRSTDDTAAQLDKLFDRLSTIFSKRLHVEIQRHHRRDQEHRNHTLMNLAERWRLPLVASNGVRAARPRDKELLDVMTCIRLGTSLDAARAHLQVNRNRHIKSHVEMTALFADIPSALQGNIELGARLNFTLKDLGYEFPDYPLPKQHTPMSYLRELTWRCAPERFQPMTAQVTKQIETELNVIEKLGLAGYFLIVRDIIEYCHEQKILVQGRGSAANSAVCYALSITAIDPVKMELLFERFLSEERGEWPDIDLDLPSGDQREKVIQHLYSKYGKYGAAMTANVITYRGKSAIRDVGKAFGYSLEQVDKLSTHVGSLSAVDVQADPKIVASRLFSAGFDPADQRVRQMIFQWLKILDLPRHLGQHSGGMVMARGRLDQIVPLEPASMPGRVVIQWDKEDCADLGLIKIDLLGLGMLAAIEDALPRILKHEGVTVDLAHLPQNDPAVFKMMCEADTIGVFQVESRAQMASLPRTAPKRFYDLVTQVAIIRPGPIVGGMVHPFFERRSGRAPVEYLHPCLEPILKHTLGVPLFQEQILRMAMVVAGFTGGEAEELRRAIGFKRSVERMNAIERRLRAGMEKNGIRGAVQDKITEMMTAFALYGFPESHAASFALLAYASGYLKVYHPAAFYAALLNAWPMGFYAPATLVKDAQRHNVEVRPIDIASSLWECDLEGTTRAKQSFRLGLRYVRGLRETIGRRIEQQRALRPFENVQDLARRCSPRPDELTQLALAGAFGSLGLQRRAALWQVAQVNRSPGPIFDELPDTSVSPLPEMTAAEITRTDYDTTYTTVGPHAMAHHREYLIREKILSSRDLGAIREGTVVKTAGSVIVRQRPGTAKGFVFLTLEDEFGTVQAILNPDLFQAQRALVVGSGALIVEGSLQRTGHLCSIKVRNMAALDLPHMISHDFS
jgi:error-prone DNA polymerase